MVLMAAVAVKIGILFSVQLPLEHLQRVVVLLPALVVVVFGIDLLVLHLLVVHVLVIVCISVHSTGRSAIVKSIHIKSLVDCSMISVCLQLPLLLH